MSLGKVAPVILHGIVSPDSGLNHQAWLTSHFSSRRGEFVYARLNIKIEKSSHVCHM
jgi:hypothetical protein